MENNNMTAPDIRFPGFTDPWEQRKLDELIEKCGFRPYHLLTDSDNQPYLCTNEASDQKVGKEISTAASVIGWAVKWFLSYELVLTGDLDKNDFMTHGRI